MAQIITFTKEGDTITMAQSGGNGFTRTFKASNVDLELTGLKNKILLWEAGKSEYSYSFDKDSVLVPDLSASTTEALFNTLTAEGGIFFFSNSVTMPEYANTFTATLMYVGAALPNPDGGTIIDGVAKDGAATTNLLFISTVDATETGVYTSPNENDWIRHPSYNTGAELNALMVTVNAGTVYAGTTWFQRTATPTVGVSNIIFDPAAVMIAGSTYASTVIAVSDGTTDMRIRHLHNTRLLTVGLWYPGGPFNAEVFADGTGIDETYVFLDLTTLSPSAGAQIIVLLQSPNIPA